MKSFAEWLEEDELQESILGNSLQGIGRWVARKWESMEGRYGRKAALVMVIGILATLPIPFNITAIIGVAEAVRGISHVLSPQQIKQVEMEKKGQAPAS